MSEIIVHRPLRNSINLTLILAIVEFAALVSLEGDDVNDEVAQPQAPGATEHSALVNIRVDSSPIMAQAQQQEKARALTAAKAADEQARVAREEAARRDAESAAAAAAAARAEEEKRAFAAQVQQRQLAEAAAAVEAAAAEAAAQEPAAAPKATDAVAGQWSEGWRFCGLGLCWSAAVFFARSPLEV